MRITMRTRFQTTILPLAALAFIASTVAVVPAHALDISKMLGNPEQDESLNTFKLIHVNDLANQIADPKSDVTIYDANLPDTRARYGVIPGAHLLPSADDYSVAQTLPPNKNTPLVFYCANTACMASHQAARRAVGAGYTDVSVMADGIMGWKKAGEPTASASHPNDSHS
jgi:rhodanese-related sulfurtransferase